jgi:hypothetical protein
VFEVKGPAHKYAPALFACSFVAPAYRFVSIFSVTDIHNMRNKRFVFTQKIKNSAQKRRSISIGMFKVWLA